MPCTPSLLPRRYAQQVLGINHRRWRHHVLVLPRNMSAWMGSGCTWAGNAVVGFAASSWSYAWINGDLWDKQQLYLHEIGHNYKLGHSATFTSKAATTHRVDQEAQQCSHCDWSSTMVGGGPGPGCCLVQVSCWVAVSASSGLLGCTHVLTI
jgi:hypothetical protein